MLDDGDIAIAEAAVKAQLVTRFQANCILRSRTRGLRVGEYRVLTGLDMGGMGEIYLARALSTQSELVVIKMLRQSLRSKPQCNERFRLEAEALRRITSPKVVSYIDSGTLEGTRRPIRYLITEYIRGASLFDLILSRGMLPWQQACDLLCQIATGLQAIHAAGYVHRDLKPSNVLIDPSGTAKIVDLGLALDLNAAKQGRETQRKAIGTERFSAPEQFVSANEVDHRADVYALGTTFLFLLTGRALPKESNEAPEVSASEILQASGNFVPSFVREALAGMLARSPEARFETPEAAVQSLLPHSQKCSFELPCEPLRHSRVMDATRAASKDIDRNNCDNLRTYDEALSTTGDKKHAHKASYPSSCIEEANNDQSNSLLQIQALSASNEELTNRLQQLQLELDCRNSEADAESFRYKARISEMEEGVRDAAHERNATKQHSAELQLRLDLGDARSRKLKAIVRRLLHYRSSSQQERRKLRSHKTELQSELAVLRMQLETSRETAVGIGSKLIEAEDRLKQTQVTLQTREEAIAHLRSTLASCDQSSSRLHEQIALQSAELATIRERESVGRAESEAREAALRAHISQLAAELELTKQEALRSTSLQSPTGNSVAPLSKAYQEWAEAVDQQFTSQLEVDYSFVAEQPCQQLRFS